MGKLRIDGGRMDPAEAAKTARQHKVMRDGIVPAGKALHNAMTRALIHGEPGRAQKLAAWLGGDENADRTVAELLRLAGVTK